MPDTTPRGPNGVIHDIGYQRYAGERLGRRYIARSMYVHGLRTAFGLGRSARTKILPVGLLAVACVTSLVLVMISTQLGRPVLGYVQLAGTFAFLAAAFVAVVGPELLSRDLRNNLLPLYFSRPVSRTDYALTKLASLASAVFLVLALPMLIMFLGMAFSAKVNVPDEALRFLSGLVAAAVAAVLFSAIAGPLSALTGRRVFATGMVIALFLLSTPIAGAAETTDSVALTELAGILSPVTLLDGVSGWLFPGQFSADIGPYGPVYGLVALAVIAAGTGLCVLRYKKVRI